MPRHKWQVLFQKCWVDWTRGGTKLVHPHIKDEKGEASYATSIARDYKEK